MASTPATPLDDIVAALDGTEGDGSMSRPAREMLDDGSAVAFPFTIYDETFTVLVWLRTNYRGRSRGVSCVLYEDDSDLPEDQSVRSADYLKVKHIRPGELADDEAAEDIAHLIATALGYFTRYLLDGRNHSWRSTPHDEPTLTSR